MWATQKSWQDIEKAIKKDDRYKFDTSTPLAQCDIQDGEIILPRNVGPLSIQNFELTPNAINQVCARTNTPAAYYKKLRAEAPDLADQILRHGMHASEDTILFRGRGARCRAILSEKFTPVDNNVIGEIFSRVLRNEPHTIIGYGLSDESFFMKVALDDSAIKDPSDVAGSRLRVGMYFRTSEVGAGNAVSLPFMNRESCLNDATLVAERIIKKRHVGFSLSAARRMLTREMNWTLLEASRLLESCLRLRDYKIFDTVEAINRLAKATKLPKSIAKATNESFSRQYQPENNAWACVNAFTFAAQSMSAPQRALTEASAGKMYSQSPKFWEAITA